MSTPTSPAPLTPNDAHALRIPQARVRRLLAHVIAGNLDVESVRPQWARLEGRRLDGVLPMGPAESRQPKGRF